MEDYWFPGNGYKLNWAYLKSEIEFVRIEPGVAVYGHLRLSRLHGPDLRQQSRHYLRRDPGGDLR